MSLIKENKKSCIEQRKEAIPTFKFKVFRFFLTVCLTMAKETNLPYYLLIVRVESEKDICLPQSERQVKYKNVSFKKFIDDST